MASLMDIYSGGGMPMPFQLSAPAMRESDMREDAGLTQSRLTKQFGERALPNLVNRQAARGTFHSGQSQVKGDQLREDYLTEFGDVSRNLGRSLADLTRSRILASMGVNI